ncbi:MAG TPA: beta-L-arabinofuranosidase domain-containing protein [Bryobacteraceae bacterium]|nr:beta-L-arabinofuranosidase domain-containing protein [Bryobacteraceae bacterium]
MTRITALVPLLFIALPGPAAPPRPAIVNAVADVYRSFLPDQEKLGGMIGSRLAANSEGYIEHISPASEDVTKESTAIDLDAAAYTFEYKRDPQVNAVMTQLARRIISAIGSTDSGESTGVPEWSDQQIWTYGADLRGLLNYYRITADSSAFTAAGSIGNLFLSARHQVKDLASLAPAIEPMVHLYRFTEERKYLNFCTAVAEAWIHAKRPELPITYSNLTVLNGLVELYRADGDNSIFRVPLQAWTTMEASGFSLTGVPIKTFRETQEAPDACTTGAWLQLSLNLLRITGQAVYSEQLERTIYNQLFAAQDSRTGAVLSPVGWSGKKQVANASACAANEIRALAELPFVVWGRFGNGIAVNLYSDGRTTVNLRRRGTIHLYIETNYPESGTILLHIEPDHPIHFPLRLRVPDWAGKFTADVGFDHFVGKPADYVTLNRNWKKGDTIKIEMPLQARVIPGIDGFSSEIAVARGPQVLALGKPLNPQISDFAAVAVEPPESAKPWLTAVATNFAANWMGEQAYSIPGTYDGRPRKLVLVPFADAIDYRVWLAKSKASSGASAR